MLKNHNGENENLLEEIPMHSGKFIFPEFFSYLHCKTPIFKHLLLNDMIN